MVTELDKYTTLTGKSGTKYDFSLWTFDDFDDIKGTFTGEGLYLFTRRFRIDEGYKHEYIYLGETEDYYERYDNHHKEDCIKKHKSNCIGFYSMTNSSEEKRKAVEDDILAAYNFPCNDKNN